MKFPNVGTPNFDTIVFTRGILTVTQHVSVQYLYNVVEPTDMHDISVESPDVIYWRMSAVCMSLCSLAWPPCHYDEDNCIRLAILTIAETGKLGCVKDVQL